MRAPAPASLASQPSILDRHDRVNCGPQVLIAAISVTAICGVLKTRGWNNANQMSIGAAIDRRGSDRVRTGGSQFRRGLSGLAASDAGQERKTVRLKADTTYGCYVRLRDGRLDARLRLAAGRRFLGRVVLTK